MVISTKFSSLGLDFKDHQNQGPRRTVGCSTLGPRDGTTVDSLDRPTTWWHEAIVAYTDSVTPMWQISKKWVPDVPVGKPICCIIYET